MAEQINVNVNVSGEVELGKITKKMDDLGKNTNKTSNYMSELRSQLKKYKSDMLQAEEGTREYNEALAKVADIQFRIKDANDKARLAIMDLGTTARNTTRVIGGMTGAFQTGAGIISLFGAENESTLKIIQKVQAAMAVTQGILAFAEGIDDLRDLLTGLSASSKIASVETNNLNDVVSDTAKNYSQAAANVASNTTSMRSLIDVQKEITDTQDNIVLTQTKAMKAYRMGLDEEFKSQKEILAKSKQKLTQLQEEAKASNTTTDTIVKNNAKVSKSFSSVGANILKSLGWTAAITLAISGVIWIVSKLIEKMNEIPKDLEVRINLNEEVYKNMANDLVKITKFTNDWRKANKDADKERIKSLEEYGKKEFKLNDDRLKFILNVKENWRRAFDDYLKKAKDTYFAEMRIKAGAEAEFNAKQAEQKALDIKDTIRQTMTDMGYSEETINSTISRMTSGKRVAVGMTVDALVRKWREANNEVIKYNEKIKILSKIKIKPVDFGTAVPTPTPTTTPTTTTKITDKTFISTSAYTEMLKQLNNEIVKSSKLLFKQSFKLPELTIPKNNGVLLGSADYYSKQLDDLQYQYDKGLLDYSDFLFKKGRILETAESFNIKLTETSFQNQQTIAEYHYQKLTDIVNEYQYAISSLTTITDAFANIYDTKIQVLDNYYNAERTLIEQSTMNEESKNKRLYELDQERYKKQKEVFEKSKGFQIASVYLGLASGLMGSYVRAVDPRNPIPTPFNWITAGLEVAGLIAQSVSSVASINAQSIEAPSAPSKTNVGSIGSNISLSPTRTSMTSSTENLNKMMSSKAENAIFVKVSEINDVQNNVKVREKNQKY